jgi:hypothetical protein
MGFRVRIPGNKPEIEYVLDHVLNHPLKGFEIDDKNKGIMKSLGYHASDLVEAGILDILYNRRTHKTTIMAKTDVFKKRNGSGKSIEYILGDKLDNTLEIDLPTVKIPKVKL